MGMIIGRADIRTAFERAWTASYVTSLLMYGERSKRKAIKEIYLQLVETGIYINSTINSYIPFIIVFFPCRRLLPSEGCFGNISCSHEMQ